MEEWRSLKGLIEHGDYYEVSNLGNIRSIDRTIVYKTGQNVFYKGRQLNFKLNKDGYYMVSLSKNSNSKWYLVNRLVGFAFLPNPNNLPEINHKDECRTNNVWTNLEWCTHKYNVDYSGVMYKAINANKIKVEMYDFKTMEFIREFDSIKDASDFLNITSSPIVRVCKGTQKQTKGYYFKYKEEGVSNVS